jgi:hypothetical protein
MIRTLKMTLAALAVLAALPANSRAADDRLVGTTCQELYDSCVGICKRQGFPNCQICPNGKKSCDTTGVWKDNFVTIKVPPGRPR